MGQRLLARSLAVLLALAATWSVSATETDQYSSWGKPIKDSTEVLNAWFTRELQRTLAGLPSDRPPATCWDVTVRFQRRLRFLFIFHPVEVWSSSSPLVGRYPGTPQDEHESHRSNIYSRHGLLDVGMWMPLGDTIEVAGVRIGTDKLAHFVSLGWKYYRGYRRLVRHGMSPEKAELTVIRKGVVGERYLLLGYRTSGILSISDLEADNQGMRFYRDLCSGPNPVLELSEGRWRIRRPIDLARYVTPEWDESYEPQIFRKGRWSSMLPMLRGYCHWLDSPWLEEQRKRYSARDGLTLNESVVLEMVEQGKLPDPTGFTLEAVCGQPVRPLDGGAARVPVMATPTVDLPALEQEIADEQAGKKARLVILPLLGWTRPNGPSGSLALMLTHLEPDADCATLCEISGPYAQLGAGTGGGRLSLGYGQLLGELRRDRLLTHAYLGYGLKATLLRTWSNPVGAPPSTTYLGAAAEVSIARVNIELGALRRVQGRRDDRWLFTWGLGFGF
ncbi:MAG: hypothetical protein LJE95_01660 [Acidobacteria bacterium]|nr:hypothetical protein [Acidobacteriota bacterium]